MKSIHAEVVDGIERPCDNCDTTNYHWSEPTGGDCREYIPRQITMSNPAWDAMLTKARELGLPHRYTSDLFRDWEIVTGNTRRPKLPPYEFVWAIYESGTHLIRLDDRESYGRGEFQTTMFDSIAKNFGHNGMHWFNWHRHLGLVEVTPEKARELCSDFDYNRMRGKRAA